MATSVFALPCITVVTTRSLPPPAPLTPVPFVLLPVERSLHVVPWASATIFLLLLALNDSPRLQPELH